MNFRWLLVLVASLGAVAPAYADPAWGTYAIISSTMGAHGNRLCMGDGVRISDIGCPSYSPSVTTAGDVSVTGNLSAAKFIGDGSALTGLSTSTDRITSGTSSVIVNSATSTISFTTGGSERMVISSTGDIRFLSIADPNLVIGTDGQNLIMTQNNPYGWQTGLKFTSNKAIQFYSTGTPTNYYLPVDFALSGSNMRIGNVMIGGYSVALPGLSSNNGTSSFALLTTTQGAVGWGGSTYAPTLFIRPGDGMDSNRNAGHVFISGGKADGTGQDGNVVVGYDVSRSVAYGRVGIANASPKAKLDVTGTISASDIVQVGSTTTIACGSSVYGAVRYTNISDTLQICTSGGWKSLVSGTATATGLEDRIISGTSSVIVNSATSTISFTTAGSQRMVIDGSGNVGVGTNVPTAALNVSNSTASNTFVVQGPLPNYGSAIEVSNTGNITLGYTWQAGNSYQMRLLRTADRIDVYSKVRFINGSAGTQADPMSLLQNSAGNSLMSQWWDATNGASYRFGVSNTYAHIDFATNTKALMLSTNGLERVRINSSGNVGISNTSPIAKLDVTGTISASDAIQVGQSSLTCASSISGSIRYSTTSDTLQICTSGGWKSLVSGTATATGLEDRITSGTSSVIVNSATSTISFTTAGSQRMVIDSSGMVGIGLTNPTEALEVNGNLKLGNNGYLKADGTPVIYGTWYIGDSQSVRVGSAVYDSHGTRPGITFANSAVFAWNSVNNAYNGATDIGLSRGAAGKLYLGNGGANDYTGSLIAGNIGIGTASPNATLQVSGTATIVSNVAIGMTATPSATLDVSGTIRMAGTGNETCGPTTYNTIRVNPATGAVEMCRR